MTESGALTSPQGPKTASAEAIAVAASLVSPVPFATRMVDAPDPSDLFVNNALLAGIAPAVFKQVVPLIKVLRPAPDEIIFAENDPGESLYLIAKGSVKISKRGRGGQQETLTYLLENDYFGEMTLVDSGKRSAQASSVGDSILGQIDRATWDLLLRFAPNEVMGNFARSVTQRLRQNNQHFIEEMMRSERLSLLGTTISSIVHDMNNPIGTILGACQVIQSAAHDTLTIQMSGLIRDAIDRMETMARELIDFSRGNTELRLKVMKVPELVEQLESEFIKCRIGAEVQVVLEYRGEIRIDRHRMLRVFGNLLKNAREAMKMGDPNVLRFSVRQVDNVLRFEVSDTGHGIKADLLPKIFEPFTTAGKRNGTGLGLAISKSVVEAHSGTIAVKSDNTGTTFTIDLPMSTETVP
jgi:signal transduction histidine kinase